MVLAVHQLGMEFDRKWVLEDVSLAFRPGRVHGLVGHNGSGKSTLIKILAGYHAASRGHVTLDGIPIGDAGPSAIRGLGIRFVHQDLGLIPQFTALENFGLGGIYSQRAGRVIDWNRQARRLKGVLDGFGSEVPMDVPVGSLSAVQRSLIAIARAVETGPGGGNSARFLILDEPTTALEGPEIEVLFDVVRSLCSSGIGVVYVSHNLRDVIQLGSDISVLRNGRCVETFVEKSATYDSLLTAMLGEPLYRDEHAPSMTAATAGPNRNEHQVARLSVRGLRSGLLRGVDLDLFPGECVAVMGLSGSGREQLVYALAGSEPSEADAMSVDGAAIPELSPMTWRERRVALVPGNRMPGSSISEFTVRENLSLVSLEQHRGRLRHLDRASERSIVRRWVKRLEILPDDPEYTTRNLSGGNRQKLILAKWLEADPITLLIDEPTAGVDVGAAHKLLVELRLLADEGRSLLVTTSEVADVLAVADRVLVLAAGRITKELVRGRDDFSEGAILRALNQDVEADAPMRLSGGGVD